MIKINEKWFVIIVNLTKCVSLKIPMNAYDMREGLSGDILASSWCNLVMILN